MAKTIAINANSKTRKRPDPDIRLYRQQLDQSSSGITLTPTFHTKEKTTWQKPSPSMQTAKLENARREGAKR